MLFVRRRPTTVVVEEDPVARAEATRMAEERGQVSGAATALGVVAIAILLFAIGYFAWWAPMNSAQANQPGVPVVEHDTQVIEKPVPATPPTIINNPPAAAPSTPAPTVIQRDHIITVPVPDRSSTNGSNRSGSNSNDNNGSDNDNDNGSTGTTGSGDTTTGG